VGDSKPIVFVVDDDPSVRAAIEGLLTSVGMTARSFESAEEFLGSPRVDAPACVVLDVRLPGTSGLDLQRELTVGDATLPIIFITGHDDIPMSVRAMKAGAVEFLLKPFRDRDLLDAIDHALARSRRQRQAQAARVAASKRFDALTPREREVMRRVVTGMLNKQIAYDLGISEATVRIHRGHVMHKTGAKSIAELVRLADRVTRSHAIRVLDST
jgi:FixJ family two-component response regulator